MDFLDNMDDESSFKVIGFGGELWLWNMIQKSPAEIKWVGDYFPGMGVAGCITGLSIPYHFFGFIGPGVVHHRGCICSVHRQKFSGKEERSATRTAIAGNSSSQGSGEFLAATMIFESDKGFKGSDRISGCICAWTTKWHQR